MPVSVFADASILRLELKAQLTSIGEVLEEAEQRFLEKQHRTDDLYSVPTGMAVDEAELKSFEERNHTAVA